MNKSSIEKGWWSIKINHNRLASSLNKPDELQPAVGHKENFLERMSSIYDEVIEEYKIRNERT